MSAGPPSAREVWVKLTYPYTVHELTCWKIDRMFTKRERVNPDDFAKVSASTVPLHYPHCKLCGPGSR